MRHIFTILTTTFALMCAGCAAVGFMQNTADINRGTLVVTAGTSVAKNVFENNGLSNKSLNASGRERLL